jgi:hypothetical protein
MDPVSGWCRANLVVGVSAYPTTRRGLRFFARRARKIECSFTLEDVAKSGVIFNIFIVLRAVTFAREEMKKMGAAGALIPAGQQP